jgi:hypothetical protein
MKLATILLFTLVLASQNAFAASSLLEALQPWAGLYKLNANDESNNPCRPNASAFEKGSDIRLNVYQASETNRSVDKGEIVVALEQYGDVIKDWFSLFGRPEFFRINLGTKRKFHLREGLWISESGKYNFQTKVLQFSHSFNNLTGSRAGVQKIKFGENGSFVYSYDLEEYNAVGVLVGTRPAGSCEFIRKD